MYIKALYSYLLTSAVWYTTAGKGTGHYSRIEGDKSDSALSSLTKIYKALGVDVVELFTADDVFKDVNSVDKSLMEKYL